MPVNLGAQLREEVDQGMPIIANRVIRKPPFKGKVLGKQIHQGLLRKALVPRRVGWFAYLSRSHVSTAKSNKNQKKITRKTMLAKVT